MFLVCTIDEAIKKIDERFSSFQLETEEIPILDALNRVLATDIYAKCDVPHFNRSTVDGYAIRSRDSHGASEALPAIFSVIGEVVMGKNCEIEITSGEAIYVPTGGVLPQGADSVVMIEDTEKLNDDELFVFKKIAPKENVLFRGEDIKENTLVLKKGRQITPQDLGILSSIGYETVKVYQKLKFTVISTGDEIVPPHKKPDIGEVRDMNSYTISGEVKSRHHLLIDYYVVRDDVKKLKEVIEQALNLSDVVVLSGGSSVGQKDLTYQLLDEIEKDSVFVHGIAIKPGKPTIFAKVKEKLVFGLPGQPASALLVFKTFIGHIEKILTKNMNKPLFYIEAKLTKNIHSTPGRQTYQMVQLIEGDDGFLAEPIFGKSGTLSLIATANGYVVIPIHSEGLSANQIVKVYKL